MAQFSKPPGMNTQTKQNPPDRKPKDDESSAAAKYLKKGVLPSDEIDPATEANPKKKQGK